MKKGRGHHKPEIVRERDELALLYRRWMEYNRKKAICGENRNSYSKTDTDATFMHMKDDHAHLLAKCNSGLQNLHLIQPKAYLNF